MCDVTSGHDTEGWRSCRLAALEEVLGKADEKADVPFIPFSFGTQQGGQASLLYFRGHVPGVVTVTADLIGDDRQVPNGLGNYELMICQRDDGDWGGHVLRILAPYTIESKLEVGEIVGVSPATPPNSTIAALLFVDYARFTVRDRAAGLLLCLGVTMDEWEACQAGRLAEVIEALEKTGVFPFTDLFRESALQRQ